MTTRREFITTIAAVALLPSVPFTLAERSRRAKNLHLFSIDTDAGDLVAGPDCGSDTPEARAVYEGASKILGDFEIGTMGPYRRKESRSVMVVYIDSERPQGGVYPTTHVQVDAREFGLLKSDAAEELWRLRGADAALGLKDLIQENARRLARGEKLLVS
jgi:hypothetical protein